MAHDKRLLNQKAWTRRLLGREEVEVRAQIKLERLTTPAEQRLNP